MGYKPISTSSDSDYNFPEMNWRVSISIDKFNFSDTTPYKVFWQIEPPEILPDIKIKLLKNWEFYDLVLTWDNEILSQVPNSKFFPCPGIWTREADASQKTFAVSFLTSNKAQTYGHQYRQDVFNCLPELIGSLSVTKHKSPPKLLDKRSMLVPFQFSVIMENCERPGYFTEKILDAFATKTIPIYFGCPNIGNFFNMKGIFPFRCWKDAPKFNFGTDLVDVLKKLTPDTYRELSDVVEENYRLAFKYGDPVSRMVKAIEESWTPRQGDLPPAAETR